MTTRHLAALGAAATAATALLAAAPASAYPPYAKTVLVSRTPAGAMPNGPSRNAAVSQDGRFGRVVAFESDATNIAPGVASGVTNVYATLRAGPYPDNGTAWTPGRTILISKGLDGQPANGPSSLPAVDGSSRTAPTCVAFVSAASNLVRGDTNGQPDAFVARLDTGRITRVSVSSSGRQANGPTTQVAVDGRCTRVAFTSAATNLALTFTTRPSWRSARTTRGPAATRQVFIRAIGGSSRLDKALRGLTFLASASNGHIAGNRDSYDPVLSARGLSLAYTSAATNLGGRPAADATQVYRRAMKRRFGRKLRGRTVQDLAMRTQLVSGSSSGPGNGDSSDPAISADGTTFAYQTLATDLLRGATHGVTQIIRTTLDPGRRGHAWISSRGGHLGDGASANPSMTDGGTWVFFDTAARNLRPPGDANEAREILFDPYFWVVSADGSHRPLPSDAVRADTSPHGNYVVFESAGSVWMRWLGPK